MTVPKAWKNGKAGATPISAAALIDLEKRVTTEDVKTVAASGAAQTIKLDEGTIWGITLTANCTLTLPTPEAGKSFALLLAQDGSGGRIVTWPASTRWSGGVYPLLSTAKESVDVIYFECTDGEHWLGFPAGYAMAAGGSAATIPSVVQTALNLKFDAANVEESVSTSKVKAPTSYAVQEYVGKALALSADVGPIKEQTALQNITGLGLGIGKSATEVWLFKVWLMVSGANVTMDAKFGWTVPAGCTMRWGIGGSISTVPGFGATIPATNPLALKTETDAIEVGTLAGVHGAVMQGFIFGGGTEGTVQPQYAQAVSNVGNLSILRGSCAEFKRLIA